MTLRFTWHFFLVVTGIWSFFWTGILYRGRWDFLTGGPLLIAFLTLCYFLSEKKPEWRLRLERKDLLVWLSYASILLIFCWSELLHPLEGDEAYHVQRSQEQTMRMADWLITRFPPLENVAYRHILQGLNFFAAGLLLALLWVTLRVRRKKWSLIPLGVVIVAFVLMRVKLHVLEPHPPMRTFPIWLSTVFFSQTFFAYRLPSFVTLITLGWCLQRAAERKAALSFPIAWALGLAVITMPLLWLIGTLVTPSLWTTLIWTLLLIEASSSKIDKAFLIRWAGITSMAILFRQPTCAAFLFLLSLYLFGQRKLQAFSRKDLYLLGAVLLVGVPFLGQSLIMGNPATDYINNVSGAKYALSLVTDAFSSGKVFSLIKRDLGWPWLGFFLAAFLPWATNRKLAPHLILFCLGSTVMFAMGKAYGESRYQAEYILPFAVLGLFLVVQRLARRSQSATVALLGALAVFNLKGYGGMIHPLPANNLAFLKNRMLEIPKVPMVIDGISSEGRFPASLDGPDSAATPSEVRPKIMASPRMVYNRRDASLFIRSLPRPEAVLDLSMLYGPMNEMAEGATFPELRALRERNAQFAYWTEHLIEKVNQKNEFQFVLLTDWEWEIMDKFILAGWKLDRLFVNLTERSALVVLARRRN